MRRFCPLPVARCLQSIMAAESRFFFLPFRPILEPADPRALKAAISAQIWKVSLVFKEKMISDSDETMIRRQVCRVCLLRISTFV